MREAGIKSIIDTLKNKGISFSKMKALDFFAREGDWQTAYYADLVAALDAWEINPQFKNNLCNNLPNATIKIGDSHLLARESKKKYDLIVLDNPQGCYGDYCEHFDALEAALPLLERSSIIIFNVKTCPYDYALNKTWQIRRNAFYGRESSSLDLDFFESHYKNFFSQRNFFVDFCFSVNRPQEADLYSWVFKLTRVP